MGSSVAGDGEVVDNSMWDINDLRNQLNELRQ